MQTPPWDTWGPGASHTETPHPPIPTTSGLAQTLGLPEQYNQPSQHTVQPTNEPVAIAQKYPWQPNGLETNPT